MRRSKFDLDDFVVNKVRRIVNDGDVLVISSKFMAMGEGRTVDLRTVRVSMQAKNLANAHRIDPRVCELVLRESDEVLGGIPGFLLTVKDGLLTPNAGIDKSNVSHGKVILYPRKPETSAKRLREALQYFLGKHVSVVVCDSRLSPMRRGTTGVAIAASGLEGVLDMRGRRDLFGNVLKVTSQGLADDLSSAAELLMGESDEGVPMVLIRGVKRSISRNADFPSHRFAIPKEECVYMRSLRRSRPGKSEYAFKSLGGQVGR